MDLSIFDLDYVQKQQVASLQRTAAEQNAIRVQLFRQASSDWVTTNVRNRELGLPLTPATVPPKKIVVTDAGEWTEAPNTELQSPVLPADPGPAKSSPLRATVNLPADRTDQIIQILQKLNGKLDSLLAKL